MNKEEWLKKEKAMNNAVSSINYTNNIGYQQCEHYRTLELESISKKKFKVIVRCQEQSGHWGAHYHKTTATWTSSDSLNREGKKL